MRGVGPYGGGVRAVDPWRGPVRVIPFSPWPIEAFFLPPRSRLRSPPCRYSQVCDVTQRGVIGYTPVRACARAHAWPQVCLTRSEQAHQAPR